MQLFINSPATSLIQKDECFRVKGKVKTFDVSPKKIERIVISNTSNPSTQAVILALDYNVDLIIDLSLSSQCAGVVKFPSHERFPWKWILVSGGVPV